MSPSPNGLLKITLAVSLGLSCLVQGIPTSNSQDVIILDRRALDTESFLKIRADVSGNEDVRLVEREDPLEDPDDDIPFGDAKDGVQHTGMDPRDPFFKALDDYDKETDLLEGEEKGDCKDEKTQKPLGQRNTEDSVVYSPRDTVYDLVYRAASQNNTVIKASRTTGTSELLRAIRVLVNGKSLYYKEAFYAQPKERRRFIGLRGSLPFTKHKRIEAFESNDPLPPFKDPCKKVETQADHLQDLGLHTAMMKEDTPNGVTEEDWTICQNAVLGDANKKKTPGTDVIGKILNNPTNLRGISAEMNACKNQVAGITARNYGNKFDKCDRSATWGTKIYLEGAGKAYKSVTTSVAKAYRSLAKDKDSDSAKALQKFVRGKLSTYYDVQMKVLKDILHDDPPENDKDSKFKLEDCSNTADTPAEDPKKDPGPAGGATPTVQGNLPAATVKAVDPPAAPSCFPAPGQGDHFKDAHEGSEFQTAIFFCNNHKDDAVTDKIDITELVSSLAAGNDFTDDNYEIKVKSVPNCAMPPNNPTVFYPTDPKDPKKDEKSCPIILHDAWKKCYNSGRGGMITAGCLTYSIHPQF